MYGLFGNREGVPDGECSRQAARRRFPEQAICARQRGRRTAAFRSPALALYSMGANRRSTEAAIEVGQETRRSQSSSISRLTAMISSMSSRA